MVTEELDNIKTFARMLGFSYKADGEKYVEFYIKITNATVRVIFDHTQRLFQDNQVYMNIECERLIFDVDVAQELRCVIDAAVHIMKKLKEIE